MNFLVLLIESFATIFFLAVFAILVYMYLSNPKSSLCPPLGLAFLLMFFSSFGLLLYDTGVFHNNVKIISATLNVLASLIFLYIFLREELAYRRLMRLRGV